MKILRDTDDQLIVENRPILLAIFVSSFAFIFLTVGLLNIRAEPVLGFAFTGAGLFVLVVFNIAFIRRTQVILDRPRNLVELRRKSLLGYTNRTWELCNLAKASVESTRSDNSTTYRAVLVVSDGMDAGTHPITLVYSSGRGAHLAATAINNWLARSVA